MRGYELAETLDISFDELQEIAEEADLELGHHMSGVKDETAERLLEIVGSDNQTDQDQDDPDQPKQTETPDQSPDEKTESSQQKPDSEEPAEDEIDELEDLEEEEEKEEDQGIQISPPITIRELSDTTNIPPNRIISFLMQQKIMKTVNDAIAEEEIELIADEMELDLRIRTEAEEQEEQEEEEEELLDELAGRKAEQEELTTRPPVVAVLGHVDHGKTSLLDRIRETQKAEGEAGGITQNVGASKIHTPDGTIVFLDTPGHEAFTSMRARGANATDIVILVVAADDGVMPQTKESINHAQAADVPIVVAVNKTDLPTAEPMRTRQQLSELGLIQEEWGGETVFVDTSAETGEGVEELLEMTLLESELMDLEVDLNATPRGICIESSVVENQGVTTTLLVQEGTLEIGDTVLCGKSYGKIKRMEDDRGKSIEEAEPGTPAVVLGLNEPPEAGETFFAVDDPEEAREVSEERQEEDRQESLAEKSKSQRARFSKLFHDEEDKTAQFVVKTGSQGTAEVLIDSLKNQSTEDTSVEILHSDVGTITESDVILAEASDAIILGFQTGVDPRAKQLAQEKGIDVQTYEVIYRLLEDTRKALRGLLEPEIKKEKIGQIQVKETFNISGTGTVAGCYVAEGRITRDSIVKVFRNGDSIYEGEISSLKRFQNDQKEVKEGYECGIKIRGFNDIKVGDILQSYEEKEVLRTNE